MKRLYSLAAVALLTLAACNKAEMPGYLSDPDAVRIEAAVGVITRSNPLGNVDEQRKFNEGDRIAVTNAGKTVVYKLQNGTWAPENSSEYLKWDKSNLYFTAEYPAGYTTLPADQSTLAKLALADDMVVHSSRSEIPEDRILSVKLGRQNALVKIKIAGYLDQYDKDVNKINFVAIGQGSTWGGTDRLYMVEKPLVQDADGNIIENETFSAGTVGYTYSGIVCPNESRNDNLRFIYLQVSDKTKPEQLEVKGVPELKARHAYTFELYVGKESVKIGNVSVKEWTTGDPLSDGETDAVDTWDGQTTEAFAVKDAAGNDLGKAETNPILINNCAQLAYLAQKVNAGERFSGKFFKLMDDINLAGYSWTPIGVGNLAESSHFSGDFDGDGHEIMGLKVDNQRSPFLGLFGTISGATVKNLKISSAEISSQGDYGAILCGIASGSTISGCTVSGNVKNIERYAGGVVGQLIGKSVMENCTADVKLNGKLYVGGLCGFIYESNILECTVMAGSTMGVSVDGNTTEYPCVGGLVGFIQGSNSTIKKCITYATVSGLGKVGGAFGHIEAAGGHKISDCTVLGDVAVSVVPDFITDAYQGIGGFAGCLAGGNVAESKFSNCGVNGTVGKVNGESFTKGSIYGAFIGHDGSIATFTDCWYNADKTGELDAIGDNQTKTGITAKNLGK